VNVDIHRPPNVNGYLFQQVDLSRAWPWPESSVEEVRAHDIFEHLPDRILTMNELWRVLVPGGRADILVPNASRGAGFFQDPTHVSMWCRNSFQYYRDGSYAIKRLAEAYGIVARFRILDLRDEKAADEFEEVWKVRAVLEAVKHG
jgi:SAM-dependent methyltransferase